jgi:RND family efflux transporter MFP subunit
MLYRTKGHFAFGIKKSIWLLAVALIAALTVFAARHFGAPQSSKAIAAADPTPHVDVVSPRRATVARRLQSNATLEAFEETDMYAKISGYLSEVSVDIGDHIKAGQILAVVNVPEMEKELAEAEAQLESRKRSAESARLQVNHNKTDLALQEVTLKRLENLANRGTGRLVSEQAVDESRAKTEVSRADLDVAESNRALATAQVELAAATVEKTKAVLAYSRIVAPFDGVVAQRLVNRGDLVQAATGTRTTPLFKVIRIDTIRVFCDVPENEVRHVRVGDPATVKPFGFDGAQFTGTITRFAVRLNPETRNMRTEIDLANRDERLSPGMYAEVSLEMNRRPDVLTVPTSAIGTDGSGTFVYTVTGDRIERLPVKVGLSDGGRIEVAEGLSEEATVVMVAKSAPPAATAVHPNPVNF